MPNLVNSLSHRLDCGCNLHRRQFLGGAAAIGASALLAPGELLAQASTSNSPFPAARRIDVHHHFEIGRAHV